MSKKFSSLANASRGFLVVALAASAAGGLGAGCSSTSDGGVTASGGATTSPGTGGSSLQGGSQTNGGSDINGGAQTNGGTQAGGARSGGALSSGGSTVGAGGALNSGGSTVSAGGATVSAGGSTVGAGGTAAGAGVRAGGTTAVGGASAGGATSSGGSTGPGGTCPKSMATFNDITANHTVPAWLTAATTNFGISIHFGPYAVGAHHNEWDSRHMYCNSAIRDWYIANFGANGTIGYKDLAAKMSLPKYDATVWAAAFKKSKASYVQITAQHHDRFAMWDSAVTKWNIKKVGGGNHDVVGELAAAVRAQGMKFGVSNHILYGYSFQWCGASADKTVDVYDPAYYDMYGDYAGWDPTKASPYASSGPQNGGCDIDVGGCQSGHPNQGFWNEWLARGKELTDKYQPDMHWFDWDGAGTNAATKLALATYYYNAACGWGKEVALAGKGGVFPGNDSAANGGNVMIHDFETGGKAPAAGAEPKSFWVVDDKIGSTWGYTTGMTYRSASAIVSQIKNYKGRGGMLILNVSPMGDGSIPQAQLDILTTIGNSL